MRVDVELREPMCLMRGGSARGQRTVLVRATDVRAAPLVRVKQSQIQSQKRRTLSLKSMYRVFDCQLGFDSCDSTRASQRRKSPSNSLTVSLG